MIKFKTCEVMQYFEYYDTEDISVIISRIDSLTNIKKYAFIVHDKDLLQDGSLKKKHFHCILTFSNATTSEVVANTLKVEEQYINKIKSTTKTAMLYLVHRNNPEKFQYNADEVYSNFDYVDFVDDCEPKQRREDIANKIANGEIRQFNLVNFVSIDEFSKNKSYYDRCFEYRQQKVKSLSRSLDCVFISGASGTGKTTLAKMFAEKKGYSIYISSGGSHPFDNYKGEDCIILDDFRDTCFSLSDFLKLTDNNTDSLIGCRFYNKSIFECKLLIITSVKPIECFYSTSNLITEPQLQLFRRFKNKMVVSFDKLTFYEFNFSKKIYTRVFDCANPINDYFKLNRCYDFTSDFLNCFNISADFDVFK